MTVTKVTCPECSTVLRPANPLAIGKKVKCPKCANVFEVTAEGAEAEAPFKLQEEPDAPVKKANTTKARGKPGKKAGGKKTAAGAAPAKTGKKNSDDDDDGSAYTVIKEPEDDEEDKPKISYAPDESIRDMRGPAQSEVMKSSNYLIMTGAVGFFGWLILLVILLIARYLPVSPTPPEGQTGNSLRPIAIIGPGMSSLPKQQGGMMGGGMLGGGMDVSVPSPKAVKEEETLFELLGVELQPFADEATYFFVTLFVFILPGLAYSSCMIWGGVQMQTLESRPWSIAAAIMAMVPLFNSGGLLVLVMMAIQVLLLLIIEDFWWLRFYLIDVMIVQWLMSLGTGIWALVVCNSETVVAGFEYEPE